MEEIIGQAVSVGFIALLLFMLGAIVRFSIISPLLTRGAKGRLRSPDPQGVERVCGFPPPPELVALYTKGALIGRQEFELVDREVSPPAVWPIGGFVPLSPKDAEEERKVSGVPGIPLADDMDKGMYYVARDGSVRLSSPNVAGGDVEVAKDVVSLRKLQVRETPDDVEEA